MIFNEIPVILFMTCFVQAYLALVIDFDKQFKQRWLSQAASRTKRDVTVVNRNAGDPCPTIVDANRQVGANLIFGPRITGTFFGQGQSSSPTQGFKSWGGALGAPELGLMRGFNLGIPIGSKVLPSDCDYQQSQTMPQPATNVGQVAPSGMVSPYPYSNPNPNTNLNSNPNPNPNPQWPSCCTENDNAGTNFPQIPHIPPQQQQQQQRFSNSANIVTIPNTNPQGGPWGTMYKPF